MKRNDQPFLKLFHNNLVGMLLTSENHVIVDVNNHLLYLTDLESSEVIGKNLLEIGILDEKYVRDVWQQLEENGRLLNQELTFTSKNSKKIDMLFSTEGIALEGKNYWLTTFIDISKRKKAENVLANVYNRLTDGVVAFDADWNYTYVNVSAGLMMERDPVQMIGKNVWEEFPHLVGSDIQQAYFKAMEKQEMISLEHYFAPFDIWFLHMIYPSADAMSVIFKDISLRKRNEHRIEESERRFRTLTKNAPVGIFETDANGLTTYVNETWMGFTGMQFEEALGEGWLNAVHPDSKESLQASWYIKSENAEPSKSEYRLINKTGKEIWVNGSAIPVVDGNEEITGYIGTITDITALKHALDLLKKKEEALTKAQRISKVGSWDYSILTQELIFSEEQYRIFELEGEPRDTLFQAYRNKYHPEDLVKLDDIIKNAVENAEGFTYEHRMICNDGSIKYILGIGEVVVDESGDVIAIKGIGQDITDSKESEMEIIRTHQKLDTLINTIDGIVWEADASNLLFSFIGKKAEEILGYPTTDWVNVPGFWESHIHPDDRAWVVDYCLTCTSEKKQHDFEYRMIAKDKSIIWLRDIVTVIVEDEKPVSLRGIMIDITEKKKSEKILEERTEQLRELSSHLQNVREDERLNIAREIHDELGQQLTGLKMDVAWLMKKVGKGDPVIKSKFDDILKLVDSTVKSIRRIATELRPSVIDDLGLNAALEWIVSEFSERLLIEFQYENDFDDRNIRPDVAIGIFRILQESLTNIAKHASATKVVISITSEPDAIKLITKDNGVGFDSLAKPKELTFGLLGIKERTYMMKGEYTIISKPGEGTQIEIRIPL